MFLPRKNFYVSAREIYVSRPETYVSRRETCVSRPETTFLRLHKYISSSVPPDLLAEIRQKVLRTPIKTCSLFFYLQVDTI